MKNELEIKERLEYLIKSLDDADNIGEITQAKIWAQIDFINWLGVTR